LYKLLLPFYGSLDFVRDYPGKPVSEFIGARDSEWLQTDNHASIPPLSFYRLDALPATQPTASKH